MNSSNLLPALRTDLELSSEPQAAGLAMVSIRDPLTRRTLEVRGFEMSICRMVNGQRTAAELIAAAQAVGIPLTLERLTAFVGRLAHLGFLAPPEAAPQLASVSKMTWTGRSTWSSETRARYQAALREARLDHLQEAKSNAEGLLARSPDLEEARLLLEWINEQIAAKEAGRARVSFADVFAEVEQEWAAEQSAPAERDAPSRRSGPLAAVLLGVLVLVVVVPMPYHVRARYRVEPRASEPVTASLDGTLARVLVKEGQTVAANAVIAVWDGEGVRALEARLDTARQRLATAERALRGARKRDRAAADRVAELAQWVRALETERDEVGSTNPVDRLLAPNAGVVRHLAVGPGATLMLGDPLCNVVDESALSLVLTAPVGVRLPEHLDVEVEGQRVALARDADESRSARGALPLAAAGLHTGAAGELNLDLGWRPFFRR